MQLETVKRIFTKEEINLLNRKYRVLKSEQRVAEVYEDFDPSEIMLTSSFAATSALLLKLFSDTRKEQKIFFIDAGYHFKETLIYKEYLTQLYDLNVEDVRAEKRNHEITTQDETWKKKSKFLLLCEQSGSA